MTNEEDYKVGEYLINERDEILIVRSVGLTEITYSPITDRGKEYILTRGTYAFDTTRKATRGEVRIGLLEKVWRNQKRTSFELKERDILEVEGSLYEVIEVSETGVYLMDSDTVTAKPKYFITEALKEGTASLICFSENREDNMMFAINLSKEEVTINEEKLSLPQNNKHNLMSEYELIKLTPQERHTYLQNLFTDSYTPYLEDIQEYYTEQGIWVEWSSYDKRARQGVVYRVDGEHVDVLCTDGVSRVVELELIE